MKAVSLALLAVLLTAPIDASESRTSRAGVATGSRYATAAAVSVLRDGGSAMDAAAAAAFVLAVARPNAAGIGGGGFLIYYDAAEKATWSVDFRETAPWQLEVSEGEQTQPEGMDAVATPGFVRGLFAAQSRFGRKAWKDLLRPATSLASEGIDVDTPLTQALNEAAESNILSEPARAVLIGDSKPGMVPSRISQDDLADTLSRLGRNPNDLYDGATAEKIVTFVEQNGGALTIRDLHEYQPVWRAPLEIDLGAYSIQTAPPPARGGVTVAAMLAILGGYDLSNTDLSSSALNHLFAETARRATVDAKRKVGDPKYSRIAISTILSSERAAYWRSTIDPKRVTPTPLIIEQSTSPSDHTTHLSIIDDDGNIASLTLSLGADFGSGIMVPGTGILLNGALGDFTWSGQQDSPNLPEPRKRPSSPLAPMIVFKGDRPILAIGASGGDAIPACLTRVLIQITKQSASVKDAIAAPRIHQPDYPDWIDYEPPLEKIVSALRALGHNLRSVDAIGEVNAVMVVDDGVVSVSDPRGKGSTGGF